MDITTIRVFPAPDAIASALASLPPAGPARLLLAPGIYREKVVIARADTILEGESAQSTRIVWGDGAKELLADGQKRGTFRTATLRTDALRVTLRRLTVENDAAPREAAGQAIALYVDGDGFLAEDCRFIGAQDTVFAAPLPPREIEPGGFIGPKQFAPRTPQRQTYRRCTIVGDIDFLFGGAAAWFDRCTIVTRDGRRDKREPFVGYCCAPSTPEGQAYGFVFDHCRFTGDNVPDGSVYLARPWRDYAKIALLCCELGSHIAPAGFDDWHKPQAHKTAVFAEYGSAGPGAAGQRAAFAKQMSKEEAQAFVAAAQAWRPPNA